VTVFDINARHHVDVQYVALNTLCVALYKHDCQKDASTPQIITLIIILYSFVGQLMLSFDVRPMLRYVTLIGGNAV